MLQAHFSRAEIARRGQELYQQKIRSQVETEENIGKLASIDVETGDYEIDADLVKAATRLHTKILVRYFGVNGLAMMLCMS